MKQVGEDGGVPCSVEGGRSTLEHCRLCVHSVAFSIGGRLVPSPARAYCTRCTPTGEKIDLKKVDYVECDDNKGEGFRSVLNIIS